MLQGFDNEVLHGLKSPLYCQRPTIILPQGTNTAGGVPSPGQVWSFGALPNGNYIIRSTDKLYGCGSYTTNDDYQCLTASPSSSYYIAGRSNNNNFNPLASTNVQYYNPQPAAAAVYTQPCITTWTSGRQQWALYTCGSNGQMQQVTGDPTKYAGAPLVIVNAEQSKIANRNWALEAGSVPNSATSVAACATTRLASCNSPTLVREQRTCANLGTQMWRVCPETGCTGTVRRDVSGSEVGDGA